MMEEIVKIKKMQPTEDFAFKRIFGREDSKKSLLSLLNAILDGNPVIKDLTILNTETQIESRDNKASKLDIEVETDDKTIINVGLRSSLKLQCLETGDLFDRSVVYASKLISEHSKKGKSYKEPKVISIWIIRNHVKHGIIANRISPIEEIVNCVIPTKWQEGYEVFTNKSRIIWVQLSKCKGELLEKINEGLKEWIQFFRNPNEVESKDKGIKEAQYKWTKISSDDQIKAQLRAQEKYEMDRASELYCAREEGKTEGIAEGLSKGKLEEQKQIALNMKSQGLDDEFIAKCLNVDVSTLQVLLNS